MKFTMLTALAAAALSGCTSGGGGGCDTGDSTCGVTGDSSDAGYNPASPQLQEVAADCALGECVYTAEADADIGTVQLSLAETGDPNYTSGCTNEVEAGDVACGVWTEYHNLFRLVDDNNDNNGGDTKTLQLEIVSSPDDVEQNQTTLFDLDDPDISAQLTLMWVITDSSGDMADCAVYGDMPSYFEDSCTNVWE